MLLLAGIFTASVSSIVPLITILTGSASVTVVDEVSTSAAALIAAISPASSVTTVPFSASA